MKSDPTLKKWYKKINKKFFDNQLTNNVCVRWANDHEKEKQCEDKYFGWANFAEDGYHEYAIILSNTKINSLSTKLLTLAHEMIHIYTSLRDNHGPAFEAARQTISDRGIFKKNALVKGLTIF